MARRKKYECKNLFSCIGTLTACGGGNDEATEKEPTHATQEITETEEPVEKKKIMLQQKRKLRKKQQMLTRPHRL